MRRWLRGGYLLIEQADGTVLRRWPAVASMRRISKVRLERLQLILGELKAGKSVQQIAEENCFKKSMVYQSMYYLKNLGLLDPDFKNPVGTVYTTNIAKEIGKGLKL